MTTYKPYGIKELQDLLQSAQEKHLPVLTRHQRQEGVGIDFQNWDKIREIDETNLTVTAERAVTLGALEEAVQERGLHFAAMTEDLRTVTLGDFFAEQMFCLTNLHHRQPRFQVLGLEVMLADGTVLTVAGKTVKNVTGYDMCRFYISNRETLAIPLAFTIKLVSKESVQVMLEAEVTDHHSLLELTRGLRKQRLVPQVCLYWNGLAANRLSAADGQGRFVMVCSGNAERVKRELEAVSNLAEGLQFDLRLCQQPEQIWHTIRLLRNETIWHNGIKVPSLQCEAMLEQLHQQQVGCWYNPLEGSFQLLPRQADGALYRRLCEQAEQLGGCGNWYYQYQYGFAPAGQTAVWTRLQETFHVGNGLNPIREGALNDGAM